MVLHSLARLLEGVHLFRLRRALGVAGALVKFPGEGVAVRDEDATAVDLKGSAHSDILRFEVASVGGRKAMSPNELSLRDAAVVLLRLDDLASIILQVVVDGYFSNTEVFQVRLHYGLLEVAAETQDVAVEGVPGRQILELDVGTGILEDGARLTIGQRAGPPNVRGLAHLDKLWFVEGETFLLFDAHAVHHIPSVRPGIIVLVLWEGVARKVWQRFQICW
mmetsp:Transcript_96985/g.134743  ORF Transcript_96985/g.134743 Transcript_96985/m.134743 type:complete len:221 (+) Transcript_96985:1727-2389(+)